MEDLINFVINLADEELYEFLDGDSKEFFLHGGCYEFSEIIKGCIKDSRVVINNENTHCGILFERKIYDASGKVKNPQDFKVANKDDMAYMEDRFGIPEKHMVKGKTISDFMIAKIKECNIGKLIERIEGEER